MKTNKQGHCKSSGGFSLIETAIAITILSLIIMPLFMIMMKQREHDKGREDTARNERVLAQLGLYVRQNGRYPCPADPALDSDDPNFGREQSAGASTCVISSGGGMHRYSNAGGSGQTVVAGALPVADLGLPAEMAANVYGWQYRYAVTEALTQDPPAMNAAGVTFVASDGTTDLSVVKQFAIINPGQTGVGAYSLDGTLNAEATCSGHEALNCFSGTESKFIEWSEQSGFDDTVMSSLIGEKTSFWALETSQSNADAAVNITNRIQGNIGIADDVNFAPEQKMHVSSDVRVESGDVGANNVEASNNVIIKNGKLIATHGNIVAQEGNIIADQGKIRVQGRVEASGFSYKGANDILTPEENEEQPEDEPEDPDPDS